MKPSDALRIHRVAIRRVVERHRASNARVFGSALHGDDAEGSDLDILIDPTPETTLFDIGAIRHQLLQLLASPSTCCRPMRCLPNFATPCSRRRRRCDEATFPPQTPPRLIPRWTRLPLDVINARR